MAVGTKTTAYRDRGQQIFKRPLYAQELSKTNSGITVPRVHAIKNLLAA